MTRYSWHIPGHQAHSRPGRYFLLTLTTLILIAPGVSLAAQDKPENASVVKWTEQTSIRSAPISLMVSNL